MTVMNLVAGIMVWSRWRLGTGMCLNDFRIVANVYCTSTVPKVLWDTALHRVRGRCCGLDGERAITGYASCSGNP